MKYRGVIVLLLVVATLIALPSKSGAQNFEANDYADSYYAQYEDNGTKRKNITLATRNDIRIGAGVPGGVSIISLQGFLMAVSGNTYFGLNDFFTPETTYLTPLSFEYNRYRKEWLVVGVKLHYSQIEGICTTPRVAHIRAELETTLWAPWRTSVLSICAESVFNSTRDVLWVLVFASPISQHSRH